MVTRSGWTDHSYLRNRGKSFSGGDLRSRLVSLAVIVTGLITLLFPAPVSAQTLTILDCQGFLRASQVVEVGTLTSVTVQVEAPVGVASEGSILTLTNVVTGRKFTTAVQGGAAVFENVPAGTFTIEATTNSLSMAFIEFAPGALAPGVTSMVGAAVIGGGAAGVGIIAAQIADEASSPERRPRPEPTLPPSPPTIPPPPSRPNDECRTCNPDERPDPIDDFFGDKTSSEIIQKQQLAQTRLSPYS